MQCLNILIVLLFGITVGAAPQAGTAAGDPNLVGWSHESAPNPITSIMPSLLTGTTNGTFLVVPIPMATARSLIPAKWPIIPAAIRELYPAFPPHQYPLIIHTTQDHDLRVQGQVAVPDFQTIRILFPFVDYFRDGYTSFTYSKYILVTSTQTISLGALKGYGNIPIPVTFTPNHEAYEFGSRMGETCSTRIGAVTSKGDLAGFVEAEEYQGPGQIPFDFLVNITNQFEFSDREACHNQITFFNYSISSNAKPIIGRVTLPAPYVLPTKLLDMTRLQGMQVDFAWTENWNISCQAARGQAIS